MINSVPFAVKLSAKNFFSYFFLSLEFMFKAFLFYWSINDGVLIVFRTAENKF